MNGKIKVCIILMALFLFGAIATASASTKATPDNCASVGSAVVHCYNCIERKYLGTVSVLTGYEESGGEGYCIVASTAKERCSSVYGIDRNGVGFYSEFKIGGGSRDETYDTSCVEAVGKP